MKKNWTPLHYTGWNNSQEVQELLVSKGANLNIIDIIYLYVIVLFLIKIIKTKSRQSNEKNQTPLHKAAENNSKEIGEQLISQGVDVDAKDIIYLKLNI